MRLDQRRLQTVVRRGSWVVAALGIVYLFWRFDAHTLPARGLSPVLRFDAGETVVLDRRPPRLRAGDAILFRAPDGLVHLALVDRARDEDGALWVVADAPDVAAVDSETVGWVADDAVVARVLFGWPW